jgi:DNA repair protein RecN (Recombination protein N)
MHGPHDHQSLLSPAFQMDLLDSFGHLWKSRGVYEDQYSRLRDLQRQREALETDDQTVVQHIDMLGFQIKEIEDADLDNLDEAELEHEHTTAANASRILELSSQACNALTEDEHSAFNALIAAQRALEDLSAIDSDLTECRTEAAAAAVQVQDIADTLNQFVQSVNADPARLQWLEDRKALLHSLKRKYGGDVDAIRTFLDDARQRLYELETRGERLVALDNQIQTCSASLMEAATTLSRERHAAAARLSELITEHLHDLGFTHGAFKVTLQKTDPGPAGIDGVDFGFAPNVGEPMRSLKAIASSGEISRVMLAIKTVLADHDTIPVLVFDEIDTNVGGEMGNAIGGKLGGVAGSHQVICITHLPQVAVHGTRHFVVQKQVKDDRTFTDIRGVEGRDRVDEIARMMTGDERSDTALQHARELLDSASD